jgi:hypothetical protein
MLSKNKRISAGQTTHSSPQSAGEQRYVYLWAGSFMASLLSPLARRFKRDFGWRTILLTTHLRDLPGHNRFKWSPDDFDEILDVHNVIKARTGQELPDPQALSEACTLLEKDLGFSALDLIKGDRHLGLGFLTSSWFHRSRYGKTTSYQQSLDITIRLCRHFEEIFEKKPPALVVTYPAGVPTGALVSVAESRNVPTRALAPPRRGNRFFWMANRYGWPYQYKNYFEVNYHRILEAMTDVDSGGIETDAFEPERVNILRDNIRNRSGFLDLFRDCYSQIRRTLLQRLRRWEPRYGDYLTRDKVWFEFLRWIRKRQMLREPELFPHLPQNIPFVFYPLSMEPETSLQVEAQGADFQLGQIDMLAKTVPAGWNVVIKEHPVHPIPRRRSFRDIVGQYPNVLQAGTLENVDQFIEHAAVVVVVNGTIGFQAANRGKPVITFNKMYQIAVMPHVRVVTSYDELRASFRDIQNGNLPPVRERRAAVEAFNVTMAKHEFAITDESMLAGVPTRTPLVDEEFEALFKNLMDGVAPAAPAEPAILNDATAEQVE